MSDSVRTTRERIIDVSIELFSEKGFFEASMRDIAAGTGIKPASIYNHFESKARILDVILEEYFQYIHVNTVQLEAIDAALSSTGTREILDQMFFVFDPNNADRYTKILKIILHEQYREPKAGAFVRDVMFTHNESYVRAVLEKLISAGKLQPVDVDVYAKILVSLTISSSVELMHYGFEEYSRKDRVSRRRATQFLLDMIIEDHRQD